MATSIVTCGHPDRKHAAKGLCKSCYIQQLRKRTPELHQQHLKSRRVYRTKLYRTKDGWLKARAKHIKETFGLTLEEYQQMQDAQGGVCKICRRPETSTRKGVVRNLAIDHCHATKKIRGLLCSRCNTMIGHADENPKTLAAAILYLAGRE
jgi:hypothetical protein